MDKFKLLKMPSPIDTKDYPITKLVAAADVFPQSYEIPWDVVYNQGQINECVAMSLSTVKGANYKKATGTYKRFSPGFVYGNKKQTDLQDEGMIPREGLQGMVDTGIVFYEDFPIEEEFPQIEQDVLKVRDSLLPKAAIHKICAYAQCTDVDQIKNALIQLGPITGCFAIYESFYNCQPTVQNPYITVPDPTKEQLEGYHEMTIFGYNMINNVMWLKVLNSWDSTWGATGYCWIPYGEYPIAELWSITDNEAHPSSLPEEQLFHTAVLNTIHATEEDAVQVMENLHKLGLNAVGKMTSEGIKIFVGSFVSEEHEGLKAIGNLLSKVNLKFNIEKI